jgi:FixJ family two-component response regulator
VGGQRLHDVFEERLRDNRTTPILNQVQFKIDFRAWLATLTPREHRLIRAMASNERTKDIARQFGVSPGRVSQLRREFKQDWERFCSDGEPTAGVAVA